MVSVKKIPNPEGMKKLSVVLNGLEGYEGKVGWLKSAQYEDGTQVAYVAAIQEFGVPEKNIPSRSFFRTTIKEKTNSWLQLAKQGLQEVLKSGTSIATVMQKLTIQAENDVLRKIASITSPALKESTLKSRRSKGRNSAKPLVDTQTMISHLTSDVIKK